MTANIWGVEDETKFTYRRYIMDKEFMEKLERLKLHCEQQKCHNISHIREEHEFTFELIEKFEELLLEK